MLGILALHPGISYLVFAIAAIVALGGMVSGTGWRRIVAPVLALGVIAVSVLLLPAFASAFVQGTRASFETSCREAGGRIDRTVSGITEVFIERDAPQPGNSAERLDAGLANVGEGIAPALLREAPRFARVAVYRAITALSGSNEGYYYAAAGTPDLAAAGGKPVEDLPRYGLRWQRDAVRASGIQPYRLEIFDRTTGEILAMQRNFKQRGMAGETRQCPVTDPADFVRTVLLAGAG